MVVVGVSFLEGSVFYILRARDDSFGISMPKFCKGLPLCEEFVSEGTSVSMVTPFRGFDILGWA